MGMRAAVFDEWLRQQAVNPKDACVIHIGCGLDSRVLRVGIGGLCWYDVDFPEVIRERKRYYAETETYHMPEADVRTDTWLTNIPKMRRALIVMEGVSMYFHPSELKKLFSAIGAHFAETRILTDCYTTFAAKMSRFRNPINDVGVTEVFGMDNPKILEDGTGLSFVKEHEMTPQAMVDSLNGIEKIIFKTVYAGRISKKMYRLYEYKSVSFRR